MFLQDSYYTNFRYNWFPAYTKCLNLPNLATTDTYSTKSPHNSNCEKLFVPFVKPFLYPYALCKFKYFKHGSTFGDVELPEGLLHLLTWGLTHTRVRLQPTRPSSLYLDFRERSRANSKEAKSGFKCLVLSNPKTRYNQGHTLSTGLSTTLFLCFWTICNFRIHFRGPLFIFLRQKIAIFEAKRSELKKQHFLLNTYLVLVSGSPKIENISNKLMTCNSNILTRKA